MEIKEGQLVIEKRNGLVWEIERVFYDDKGQVDYVECVDPVTGHDPWYAMLEDLEIDKTVPSSNG